MLLNDSIICFINSDLKQFNGFAICVNELLTFNDVLSLNKCKSLETF